MVTRLGDQFIYNNVQWGVSLEDTPPGEFYLAVMDTDNQEVHLFPLNQEQWTKLKTETDQKLAASKLVVAGPEEMPR